MKALALIIGNSKYEGEDLLTPENDAVDLSIKLKELGFIVRSYTNIDFDSFNQHIDIFGRDLNKYDVGLFYFAGHGMQISGDNFLACTNTNFEMENSAKYSSITLYKIIDFMDKAKNETNIIILDACRNNPFEKRWSRSIKQTGLAPLYAPKGTFVAFATSPGEIASNGIGINGLYTSILLKQLDEKNVQIEELFKRVRNSVYAFSNRKQTTWEHTSLTGKFVFNSGQYIQITSTLYSDQVLADSTYKSDESYVDRIVDKLKTHNWYEQNPAIKSISHIDAKNEPIDKLFLLGRNIYQTACGGEFAAMDFLRNLKNKSSQFTIDGKNHLLNGILFEIYFNSEGKFRGESIKKDFIDEVFLLQGNNDYTNCFEFICEQLLPFSEDLMYIPSSDNQSLNIDMFLVIDKKDETIEFIVKEIKFEGKELLVKDEDSWFFNHGEESFYEPYTFGKLKIEIANKLIVPSYLLKINTNFTLDDYSKILFPFGYQIKRI